MPLDSTFVASVLEGFEGTLEELIARIDGSELKPRLNLLQSQVIEMRCFIEKLVDTREPEDAPQQ